MSSVIPEYGTREYSLWRMQVTADTLRRFVNVSDSNVSRALRHVLASDVYSGSPRDDSDEHVLQRIARNINAGRLAVFDRPLPGHAVNQWLCPTEHLEHNQHYGRKRRRAPAANNATAGAQQTAAPDVADVAAAVAAVIASTTRDVTVTLTDEHLAALGAHLKLKQGLRYKLVTDAGETREGTLQDNRIVEKALTVNNSFKLEFIAPV